MATSVYVCVGWQWVLQPQILCSRHQAQCACPFISQADLPSLLYSFLSPVSGWGLLAAAYVMLVAWRLLSCGSVRAQSLSMQLRRYI